MIDLCRLNINLLSINGILYAIDARSHGPDNFLFPLFLQHQLLLLYQLFLLKGSCILVMCLILRIWLLSLDQLLDKLIRVILHLIFDLLQAFLQYLGLSASTLTLNMMAFLLLYSMSPRVKLLWSFIGFLAASRINKAIQHQVLKT